MPGQSKCSLYLCEAAGIMGPCFLAVGANEGAVFFPCEESALPWPGGGEKQGKPLLIGYDYFPAGRALCGGVSRECCGAEVSWGKQGMQPEETRECSGMNRATKRLQNQIFRGKSAEEKGG